MHVILRLFTALRAVIYMAGFLLFWGWLAVSVRPYDAILGWQLPPASRAFGIALMAVGGAIVVLCGAFFVLAGRGTPAPFDPPRAFVVRGPYCWVRNPMYLGAFGVLSGFGLWHASVAILLLTMFAVLLVHIFVVFFEEPQLERRFDESYREYKRSVHRWLPKRP